MISERKAEDLVSDLSRKASEKTFGLRNGRHREQALVGPGMA